MRLLNAYTFQLEDFLDSRSAPPYAILSHTWTEQEVTYKEITEPRSIDALTEFLSYEKSRKLRMTCRRALEDRYLYVWIDTCCIDKTSSAELSEAINSMFQWYGQSAVCYVYLSDVNVRDLDSSNSQICHSSTNDAPAETALFEVLKESRWFTRGWTLQELLAPRWSIYFDEEFCLIGQQTALSDQELDKTRFAQRLEAMDVIETSYAEHGHWTVPGFPHWHSVPRDDIAAERERHQYYLTYFMNFQRIEEMAHAKCHDLCAALSRLTGISPKVLRHEEMLSQRSIACRMSWASMRRTTRPEDEAYCLLGIFGVNMPLLYGEGTKAFLRLQEEIIQVNPDDHSILAWDRSEEVDEVSSVAFAPNARAFREAANIVPRATRGLPSPLQLTAQGLHISMEIFLSNLSGRLGILDCFDTGRPGQMLGVIISHCWEWEEPGEGGVARISGGLKYWTLLDSPGYLNHTRERCAIVLRHHARSNSREADELRLVCVYSCISPYIERLHPLQLGTVTSMTRGRKVDCKLKGEYFAVFEGGGETSLSLLDQSRRAALYIRVHAGGSHSDRLNPIYGILAKACHPRSVGQIESFDSHRDVNFVKARGDYTTTIKLTLTTQAKILVRTVPFAHDPEAGAIVIEHTYSKLGRIKMSVQNRLGHLFGDKSSYEAFHQDYRQEDKMLLEALLHQPILSNSRSED